MFVRAAFDGNAPEDDSKAAGDGDNGDFVTRFFAGTDSIKMGLGPRVFAYPYPRGFDEKVADAFFPAAFASAFVFAKSGAFSQWAQTGDFSNGIDVGQFFELGYFEQEPRSSYGANAVDG